MKPVVEWNTVKLLGDSQLYMRSVTIIALASALSSYASAQCTVVTTPSSANFSGNFTGNVQAGLLQGEAAAVSFTLPAEAFPIKLSLAEMIFASASTTVQTTTIWRVFGYEGTPTAGSLVFDETADNIMLPYIVLAPGTNGVNVQFSVDPNDPTQIIFQDNGSHTVTLGYGVVQHNNQSTFMGLPFAPSDSNAFPTTDVGGLNYPTRNWLYAVPYPGGAPSGWSTFASLPTFVRPTGDWNIRFTYESLNPVSITDDPDDQQVQLGQTAIFQITAAGANLSYMWYKDAQPLPTNGTHYIGVTSPTLAVLNTVQGDAGDYYCVVSSNCGQVTSQPATLSFIGQAGTLSGHVNLLDFVGDPNGRPILVRFFAPGGVTPLATVGGTLNASGNYSVTVPGSLGTGSFDIGVDIQHWLRDRNPSVNITGSGASNVNFTTQNGDADDSGEVDAADIDMVIADFGGSGTMTDMDGSSEVDAADIDIVIANFGNSDE